MKKISFAILILICTGFYTLGQPGLEKGTFLLGGNLNFVAGSGKTTQGSTSVDDPKTTQFMFLPKFGYFIVDNFVLGMDVGYSMARTKEETDDGTEKWTDGMFLVGFFGRYYVHPLEHAAFFGEFNVGMGTGKLKHEYPSASRTTTDELKQSEFGFNIRPGATVFVTNKLGIEFTYGSLGYNTYILKDETSDETLKETTNSFTLSFNPDTFTCGVFFYF